MHRKLLLIEHRKKYNRRSEISANENVENNHRCNVLIDVAECSSCSRWVFYAKIFKFLIIIIKLATKTENNKLKLNCLKLIFSLIWFDLIWFVYFILLTVHTFFFSIDQIKISLILHEFLLSWFEKVFKCLLWFLQKN